MKIAQLSTFYPYRGGIAQFNASLKKSLLQNHTVEAFNFKRQYPNFLFPGKTQLVKESINTEITAMPVLDSINPFTYFTTVKSINQLNPDLLLMKYWMSFFAPSLGTVARHTKKKCTVISILDNLIPHEKRFFDNALNKYFINQNDGFVVMSKKVKHDLLESTKGKAKLIELPHPLYNHFGEPVKKKDALKTIGIRNENKNLLFFGFIRKYKGLDLLLQAFEKLDDSYNLIIAGECYGGFEAYQKIINKSRKKDQIFLFNKYISDAEVPNFMCAADACILPYRSATQSGIESIAYHFNTPIVATDVGGLKENIKHLKTGYIIPEANADSIAYGIKDFFKFYNADKIQRELNILKKERSWDNFGQKIIDFANSLKSDA